MKKAIIFLLLISSIFSYAQQNVLKLKPTAIAETSFQSYLVPTTTQYKNALEWLKIIHESVDKTKVSSIVNEEIVVTGIAKEVWAPIRGGVKSVYDVAFTLKMNFFYDHYVLHYEFGNFIKDGKKLKTTPKDLFKKYNGSVKSLYKDLVLGIENKIKENDKKLYLLISKDSNDVVVASKK
ncbi:MAG: hypothetical protein L3J45_09865 [Flavobacteriaceae bacterium]|nr:hypothetical protein [Flavobacteriaceae bacterium]